MNRDRKSPMAARTADPDAVRLWRAGPWLFAPRCPDRPLSPDAAAVSEWPPLAESVPGSRAWLRDLAAAWLLPAEVASSLALIVSELVTNAVRHSRAAEVTVLVGRTAEAVFLEVVDDGRWRHALGERAELAEGGYGLDVVAAYADRAATVRHTLGSCGWAIVALPATGEEGAAER